MRGIGDGGPSRELSTTDPAAPSMKALLAGPLFGPAYQPLVVGLDGEHRDQRISEALSGKMRRGRSRSQGGLRHRSPPLTGAPTHDGDLSNYGATVPSSGAARWAWAS